MTHHPKKPWSFDIETAISTWRQFVSRTRSIGPADLDELEIHLRDAFESARKRGMSEESAFRFALHDLGDVSSLDQSYEVVAQEKLRRTDGRMAPTSARLQMARSYALASWRNIVRNPNISALNVMGLGLGLAAVLLIGLFIRQSLSFDQFIPDAERVLRISNAIGLPDEWRSRASRALAPIIRDEWSQAEAVTTVEGRHYEERAFSIGDEDHFLDGFLFTDEFFLPIFGHRILSQGSETPLARRGSIVLTASTAKRLFGSQDPIGQTIRYNSSLDCVVDAVVADPPPNTHLPFNVLIRTLPTVQTIDWRFGGRLYVKMTPDAEPESLTAFLGEMTEERAPNGWELGFRVQPVTSVQLHSGVVDDYADVGDIRYLYIFGSIALLITVLAAINYTNLATAQVLRRAREVGVRKAIGATRGQLRKQFLAESLTLAAISIIPALLLAYVALPTLSQMTGQSFRYGQILSAELLAGLILVVILIGLGAGSYPALVLSRFRPSEIITSGKSPSTGHNRIKRLLVGIQVTVSFAMITASAVVSGQLTFIREMNLGFDQEHVVRLEAPKWSTAKYQAFAERLEANPSIVSMAYGIPPGINHRSSGGTIPARDDQPELNVTLVHVGPGFFDTMGIDLLEGRDFRREDLALDPPPVILTSSWKEAISPDESMLGKPSQASFGWSAGDVVGIVEDVINHSVHNDDSAIAFISQPEDFGIRNIVIRMAEGRIDTGLQEIRQVWEDFEPDQVFKYAFLDDQIQRQYTAETRLAGAFGMFSGVSIFIALLGLFGLATLTAQQRRSEIGIRKVLGATVAGIILLLSKEFVRLVLFGAALMTPLVFIYGNRWLDNFAHHIEIGPGLFLWSVALVLSLVLLAVGVQSWRAATANPADSIRHD